MSFFRRVARWFRRSASGARLLVSAGATWWGARSAPRYGTREVLQAFTYHGFLQSAVQVISDQVKQVQWTATKSLSDGTPYADFSRASASYDVRSRKAAELRNADGVIDVSSHEVLRLLSRPSAEMSGPQMVEMMATHLLLVGETFLELRRSAAGPVIGLRLLPPTAVTSIPTRTQAEYRISYEQESYALAPTEVVHIKRADPLEPLGRGVGLGHGIGSELDASEHVTSTIRATYARGGIPSAVVGIDQGQMMDDPNAVDDIKAKIEQEHSGPENAGKMLFTNGKVTLASVGANLRDLDAAAIKRQLEAHLRQVYRIPPELLGDLSGSNRATAEAAKYHLAEYVVFPLLCLIRDELQHRLVPQIDPTVVLDFEDPRPASGERVEKFMTSAVTAPAFSMNEVRAFVGLDADADLNGVRLLPPPGSKPIAEATVDDVASATASALRTH